MELFSVSFYVLCIVCAGIQVAKSRGASTNTPTTPDFKKFQQVYLIVYFCSVMGDWLQGPYVYALYDYYKFSKQQIGVLFIVGFGTSMIFGSFIGQYADKYGRKLACLAYVVLYIVSCGTKHFGNFYILLFGRLTGGLATSILFSAFESWMVAEHNKHFYPSEWSNNTFSLATVGNGVCAIFAGWLGAMVRDSFNSLVAPFDAAIVFLAIAGAVIWFTWSENKGDAAGLGSNRSDPRSKLTVACDTFKNDPKVLLLGMIQSCFEGAMYIFVFMWTPKMEPLFKPLPHGQVFGCFMACMMIGSSVVDAVMKYRGPPQLYMRDVFGVGAVCMLAPAMLASDKYTCFISFFIFEALCGVYWPSMGILKSKYVPEEVRATVYNIFRVPLNLIVVLVLANLGTISDDTVFLVCAFLLAAAAVMQHIFMTMVMNGPVMDSMGPAALATEELKPLDPNEEDLEIKGEK